MSLMTVRNRHYCWVLLVQLGLAPDQMREAVKSQLVPDPPPACYLGRGLVKMAIFVLVLKQVGRASQKSLYHPLDQEVIRA